jgi:small subunit ribosomal protein S14
MAKKAMVERDLKRRRMAEKYAAKRAELKAVAEDTGRPPEERFQARLKLAKLPRNSAKVRIHNRCELTGRPRGYYRKLRLSRVMLRELGSQGMIPGMTKSSW